jgi:hypothetical protein
MFFPGSRYISLKPYTVTLPGGTIVQATRLHTPGLAAVLGYHRRGAGERLDQISARYLADATQFWRICDANGAVAPDALAAAPLVGVPIDTPTSS